MVFCQPLWIQVHSVICCRLTLLQLGPSRCSDSSCSCLCAGAPTVSLLVIRPQILCQLFHLLFAWFALIFTALLPSRYYYYHFTWRQVECSQGHTGTELKFAHRLLSQVWAYFASCPSHLITSPFFTSPIFAQAVCLCWLCLPPHPHACLAGHVPQEALPWGNLPWSDTSALFQLLSAPLFCCSSYRSWWCLCFTHLMPALGNIVFESRSMFYYLWPTVPGLVPETWQILNQCLFNQWKNTQRNKSSVGTGSGLNRPISFTKMSCHKSSPLIW